MAQDPKFEWLARRIAEAFSLECDDVVDKMQSAAQPSQILALFESTGKPVGIFFFDGQTFSYTENPSNPSSGRMFYIMRTANRNVTIANLESEMLYGVVNEDYITSLQLLLERIYYPLVENQEDWGALQNRTQQLQFLSEIRKFIDNLQKYTIILEERLTLALPPAGAFASLPTEASAVEKLIEESPDTFSGLENSVAALCNQIEQFLVDSEKIRLNSDDSGPESEQIFWRARMSLFNGVGAQMQAIPWIAPAVRILQEGQSSVVMRWTRVRERVLEATNESKDNLKYLSTIDEILQPLYSGEPGKMTLTVPDLMETVRVVHSMAKYYGNRENMTILLIKISNEMIKACREFVYSGGAKADKFTERVFDANYKTILHHIDACITLLQTYSDEYAKIKEKLLLSGAEKQFNFSEEAIFGNFELFCGRLKKVADIIITRQNFSSLEAATVIGLEPIIKQQEDLVNVLKTKPYDPLSHREAEFDTDYDDYKRGIIALENSLTEFINGKFADEDIKLEDLISIMIQLNTILNRPNLEELILTKYDVLLEKYTMYIKHIAEYYNKVRKGELEPPIPSNYTPIAGRVSWCRLVQSRLGQSFMFFSRVYVAITDEQREQWEQGIGKHSADNLVILEQQTNENIPLGYMPLLTFNKHGRNVSRVYETTVDSLKQYEADQLNKWASYVQPVRLSLQSTVLVENKQTNKLYVNFDVIISELCREANMLEQIKASIPDSVKAITLHEKKLFANRDALQELIDDVEGIQKQISPDFADLFEPLLYKLQRKLQPLLASVCWTSMNLENYIKGIKAHVSMIKETTKKVNDILEFRIKDSLKAIMSTTCIPLHVRAPFGSPEDKSAGGTICDQNEPSKKVVADAFNDTNAEFTSQAQKLFSNYLEQNSAAIPYKKYLEKAYPHSQQASECIYQRSMFVASATCEIVTSIVSRYLSGQDTQNAEALKVVVMQNITACFDAEFEDPVRPEDEKRTTSQIIGDAIRAFVRLMHMKVQAATYLCCERSLRSFCTRMQQINPFLQPNAVLAPGYSYDALIETDCELVYPQIEMLPGNDKIQMTAEEMIQICLTVSKMIPKWNSEGDYYAVVLNTIPPIEFVTKDSFVDNAFETITLTKTELDQNIVSDETVELKKTAPIVWNKKEGEKQTNMTSRLSQVDMTKTCSRLDKLELFGVQNTFFDYIGQSRQMLKLAISLEHSLNELFSAISKEIQMYQQFEQLYKDDKEVVFKQFLDRKPQLEEYVQKIVFYEKQAENIDLIPDFVQQGFLLIKTEALKQALSNEAETWKNQYATKLNSFAQLELSILTNAINDVQQQVSGNINDLDDVRKIMAALVKLRELEADFDNRVFPIEQTYEILSQHNVKVSTEEVEQVDQLNYRLKTIQESAVKVQSRLEELQSGFKTNLVQSVQDFVVIVDDFKASWDEKGPRCEGIPPRTAVIRLREFQQQFAELERKWVTYSTGEKLFGLPVTEYPSLVHIQKDLKLLNQLYSLYTDVLTTIDGYADKLWSDLNFEEIQLKISDFENRCLRLPKDMREWEAFLELKQKIDDFNQILPIFEGMANEAMKDRHWQEISEKTKCEEVLKILNDSDSFKLSDILACDPVKYAEDIEDICNAAVKETDIEIKLNTVRDQWKEMKFVFDEFKSRGKVILKASETSELIVALEDSQMLLSSIQSNRFNKPFKDEIFEWVKRLSTLDETLTLWLQVQQNWIYLEAVFSSGDIARQLPAEAKRFGNIDKTWIKIMGNAFLNPGVIYLTSQDDTLKSLLPHLIEQLEECQKSLSGYLEQKRNLFSRFYFVSDPVLLEILGQQSDPHAIQNHLLSIFDSVSRVDFDKNQAKRNNIVALNDKTGENVALSVPVVASGAIEDWLNTLIAVMQRSIKDIVREAAQDLTRPDYKDLLREYFDTYPAQITLLCLQIIWTLWCEQAFRAARQDKRALENVVKKNNEVFELLVEITKQEEMAARQRTNVETLITIHVHERDIFNDLVANKVRSANEFDWLKQTRFYWNTEMDTCRIQITDIDFTYNYEYLGVNERLVITPLTDRCYITLAEAIGMCLGGAPAGPAGTGKTETVKDMGKTLGMFVVVFNCSDQMDYKGLGKIFRGIAQCGCYGDFDEFNRIELDVMSVAAQQISCILSAIKEKKKSFLYTDGCEVSLLTSAAYFITMNPGYAGRQELLENLKALFRSVAMMVPDRQIIIDVKLAAAGFSESKSLAKKFFILYELCQEQLSEQRHYDFGLRNILSVLRNCGSQRRENAHDKSLTESFILLRVLRDMNRSKLVAPDIPLFESLTTDLFPGIKPPENKYEDLEAEIVTVTQQLNIQRQPDWVKSIIQFYETYNVRHSIMLLGPTLAGKSCTLHTLGRCLENMLGTKFQIIKMNPKAITAPQMFGRLDASTGDWTDGIFSALWRKSVRQDHYIMLTLNGPVDAVWIENLNTVMDDNKTLTLANSDRIPMSKTLKLILEIDSLENASPATVSRAGMIYMSGFRAYGWRPFYNSWIKGWSGEQVNSLTSTLDTSGLLDALYEFIDLEVKPLFNVPQLQLARELLFLLTSLIYDGTGLDSKLMSGDEKMNNNEILTEAVNQAAFFSSEGFVNSEQAQYQCIAENAGQLLSKTSPQTFRRAIVFAIMWSFGAVLDLDDRKLLQKFLFENASAKNAQLDLPKLEGSVDQIFNYFINDSGEWERWQEVVPTCEYPPAKPIPFGDILIPTVDNVATNYLLEKLNRSQFNILLTGESGSGKTKDIFTFLSSQDRDKYAIRNVNFSSATTMGILQSNIEAFVEKRMGTSYGPVAGKKGIVFIDEVNIPEINEWNDQPTNELTREIIEERGLYALDKPGEFHSFEDMTFIAAMPIPGGGRNDIPSRLKAQYCTFNVNLPAPEQLDIIFGTIIKGHYSQAHGFADDVVQTASRLVAATRKLWQATKLKMLPTPSKFHYIFNLRDLSRITQGFINVQPETVTNSRILAHLWANECCRVLPDKFTTESDIAWFNSQLYTIAEEELSEQLSAEVENYVSQGIDSKYIYFADFMRDPPDDIPEDEEIVIPKIYEPVYDRHEMVQRLELYMKDHNDKNRKFELKLVLFDSCIQHILRISRIIRTPGGHALLVGVGGSGKQSCARMAAHIAGYDVFELVMSRSYGISNFEEDLRKLYKEVGISGRGCAFVFTDNDVKEEVFLEKINNILTSGEIPALFPKDEVENIVNDIRPVFKRENPRLPDTNELLWNFFIERNKAMLHIILCFSPASDKFRTRSRKFPGLISGCTTDWFQPWSREALEEVAETQLSTGIEIKANNDQTVPALIQFIANIHSCMVDVTQQYFEQYRRQTYVTPKSYLSFLSAFKQLYNQKVSDLSSQNNRLKKGLEILQQAGDDVAKMRISLEVKEKELAIAQAKTDEMMKEITIKKTEAEKVKAVVQKDAEACEKQAAEIEAEKQIAEDGLAAAMPLLEKAEAALNSITAKAINNVKTLGKPPYVIQKIFDAVLILFNEKMERLQYDPEKASVKGCLPSWQQSITVMEKDMLKRLQTYDKDTITDEQCELLMCYIDQPDFKYENALKSFGDVAGLFSWVIAMRDYHFIALEVEPKRRLVREMEAVYKQAMDKLKKAQDELDAKEAALNELQAVFDKANGEKQALQDEAELTQKRLSAASALINGLSGERKRWGQEAKELDDAILRLVGDVTLAAAFESYAGPFNQQYRTKLLSQIWLKDLIEHKLPYTKNIENEIIQFLVSEAQVGEWRLEGLPTDDLSTQNGLIVSSSSRYPLMIDPQNQAATWIKNMYKNQDIKVTTLNNKRFRMILEMAVENGLPLLIEDVEEDLDPVLDPILEKQYIITGTRKEVKIGDQTKMVDENFKLFITTKLPNPKYSPETYAKTSIIDFTVTFGGLEQQLLSRTVNIERKELEEQRVHLLEEINTNKKIALQLEEDLLNRLSNTTGNLLDDADLVEVLNKTKATTEEVKEKLANAAETEKRINEAREEYLVVATRGAIIYFLITDMSLVNNMYQTSLKQFLDLFDLSINEAPSNNIAARRIELIIEYMTFKLFKYIVRGLYERDKLLFTLNLCLEIDIRAGRVTDNEFKVFIRGGAALDLATVRSKPEFISDTAWLNIVELSQKVPSFSQLEQEITENESEWKTFYNEEAVENCKLPSEYEGRINEFERLLLIRCLREDRAMLASSSYIISCFASKDPSLKEDGREYVEPVVPDYDDILANETTSSMPVCFLLSLGSDPTGQLETFAKKRKIELRSISMGEGQEPAARRLIAECITNGGWAMINNSHLAIKFMSEIEDMILDIRERSAYVSSLESDDDDENESNEKQDEEIGLSQGTGGIFASLGPKQGPHADFRLILTTEESARFPIGLLQKCIKLTNDPPSGLRAGLKRTFAEMTEDLVESVDKPQWLPLVYSIAYIHSTIIERKKYGPLGWCIKYEFGEHDFNASVEFLQSYLYSLDPRKNQQISWKTICYMIAEVHYGGRITDDFDRRLMNTYTSEWISPAVLEQNYQFCNLGYKMPTFVTQAAGEPATTINDIRKHVDALPMIDKPQAFLMHPNAELTFRSAEAQQILGAILSIQPKDSGSSKAGGSREDNVLKQARDILAKLPPNYDFKVQVPNGLRALNSDSAMPRALTVFLGQEIERMQKVLSLIRSTLTDLQQAIAGTIIMTEHLQDALNAIFDARVPAKWLVISWPSPTLGYWLSDVIARCNQYTSWLTKEQPYSFWLTGFFNPTGFLTSVKQEITRSNTTNGQPWSLDRVQIQTVVEKFKDEKQAQVNKPKMAGSVYIHGLYLEGAQWEPKKEIIIDAVAKQLFSPLPVLLVEANENIGEPAVVKDKSGIMQYDCPVYKTPMRTGLNYVFTVKLRTEKKPSFWTMRGTALLCNMQ